MFGMFSVVVRFLYFRLRAVRLELFSSAATFWNISACYYSFISSAFFSFLLFLIPFCGSGSGSGSGRIRAYCFFLACVCAIRLHTDTRCCCQQQQRLRKHGNVHLISSHLVLFLLLLLFPLLLKRNK